MWTVDYIISQICMALGMLLLGATYFMKINKNILICSIIYAILFCGHYLFLDAYMGVVINILNNPKVTKYIFLVNI